MSGSGSQLVTLLEKVKDKEEYMNWKFSMLLVLIREKLWSYAVMALCTDADAATREKDTNAWNLICLHVEKSLYPYV
jgi:hypothetical protein